MNSIADQWLKGLGICEYRMSQDSFLLCCAASCTIRDYQLEMLANNPHPGILALEKHTLDTKVILSYNITGKVPLSEYLRETVVTADLIAVLYNTVTAVLSASQNYLLDPAGFLLDENYLFIDPKTSEIALVYVPVFIKEGSLIPPEGLFLRLLKEGRLKIKSEEREMIRALEEYLDSGSKPGFLDLSQLHLTPDEPVKAKTARDIKPYKLDEGMVMKDVSSREEGIFAKIFKKRFLVFVSMAFPALFLALALVRMKLPAGNFLTFGGLLLIMAGINLLIIRKAIAGLSDESVEALFLQGKEAAEKFRRF